MINLAICDLLKIPIVQKWEQCLKYGDLIYDVIMDLFGIIFMNFYNQQNCMVIGFNLMYNFN